MNNITKKEAIQELGAFEIKIEDIVSDDKLVFQSLTNNRRIRKDQKIWIVPCFSKSSGGFTKRMGVHYCLYINKQFVELAYFVGT